ncbi:LAMI_0B02058g1_1 [Lachancea mirantina]|uniref:LAMI_0B02058g1_1 n=1 Tax=Lachancea mirantina TaxID=1230905 RepID=A0A1G4ITR8_9SACH|nr:LAMI_0B02058g1_1 [Lachancea mirantina]
MSLPLRRPLENVASLDRALEDLIVRFIINCPAEDFSSVERELFHVEEASWFYTDFIKLMNPNLPNMKIKSFAQHVIKLCPLIWKWDDRAEQALQKFSQYKKSIPVRGAAIFNKSFSKILLVKGTESDSWSFPRGKISKDENDVDCCIREVLEEINFDLTDYIDEEQFIERNIQGKNYKIFLVSGVPQDFDFKPRVRNEIEKIEWREFKKITRNGSGNGKPNARYYLVNSMIRPLTLWVKSKKQVENEDQLKSQVEEQLKVLLGIKKEDAVDPGRELLDILQKAVNPQVSNASTEQNGAGIEETHHIPPFTIPAPTFMAPPPQFQQQFPFMAFQPFAPFPFMNGSGMQIGSVPQSTSEVHDMTRPPPIPSMNVNAKPSVAEDEVQTSDSRELLNLLKKKNATPKSSPKPKMKLLRRGEEPNFNDKSPPMGEAEIQIPKTQARSDSKILLDVLKNANQPAFNESSNVNEITATNGADLLSIIKKEATTNGNNYQHPPPPKPASTFTEESSDYEDFECSSEDDHEEQTEQLRNLEAEEDPSGPAEEQVLKEDFINVDAIPHVDPELDMSVCSIDGDSVKKTNEVPNKPKIKLLRRGQTLGDVVSRDGSSKNNEIGAGQLQSKPQITPANDRDVQRSASHYMDAFVPPQESPAPNPENFVNTVPSINNQSDPRSGSQELLKLLKKPSLAQPHNDQPVLESSPVQTGPASSNGAGTELLQLLKGNREHNAALQHDVQPTQNQKPIHQVPNPPNAINPPPSTLTGSTSPYSTPSHLGNFLPFVTSPSASQPASHMSSPQNNIAFAPNFHGVDAFNLSQSDRGAANELLNMLHKRQ